MDSVITSFVGDKILSGVDPASLPKTGSSAIIGGRQAGRVVDIIGNIKKPYCVITKDKRFSGTEKIIGEKIFFRRRK